MGKQIKKKNLISLIDETINISKKKKNGILRFLANIDNKGNLVRYSLAYINTNIFNGDNGRVLGYDNNHGYHHRHHMGTITKINFISFENIKEIFEKEWREIHEEHQTKKN